AARSLGMSNTQTLTQVIVPQAVRTTVPPLANTIVAMVTNSAVVGAFGVGRDLFSVSAYLTSSLGYPNLPVLTAIGIGYMLVTIPIALFLRCVERKVAIQR